jgi:hypothetical protein
MIISPGSEVIGCIFKPESHSGTLKLEEWQTREYNGSERSSFEIGAID